MINSNRSSHNHHLFKISMRQWAYIFEANEIPSQAIIYVTSSKHASVSRSRLQIIVKFNLYVTWGEKNRIYWTLWKDIQQEKKMSWSYICKKGEGELKRINNVSTIYYWCKDTQSSKEKYTQIPCLVVCLVWWDGTRQDKMRWHRMRYVWPCALSLFLFF